MSRLVSKLVLIIVFSGLSSIAGAENTGKWEIGARFDGNLGDGTPANDILGATLLGRYRLNDKWLVGGAVEFAPGYDFERPYKHLNIASTTELDSSVDGTMVTAWLERRYNEPTQGGYWFWSAGLGVNNLSADDTMGTTPLGTSFTIKTDIDTEIVAFLTAGRRHNVGDNFSFDYGVRLAEHFGDWTITDLVSGTKKKSVVDSYFIHGVFISVNYRL